MSFIRSGGGNIIASGSYFGGWTPLQLGASLLAWWSADRTTTITESGGAVSAWADIVQGCSLAQATGANQPVYSATSFGGRPGVAFDGTDDFLRASTNIAWMPTGAAGSEDWYAVDQRFDDATATNSDLGSWGGTSNALSRRANRGVTAGQSRGRSIVGDGVSSTSGGFAAAHLFGRCVARYVVEPTQFYTEVRGVASTTAALVPGTGSTSITMGANNAATPTIFGNCIIAERIVTGVLTAAQADALRAYLVARTP